MKIDPKGIAVRRMPTKNKGGYVFVRQKPVGGDRSVPASFWKYKQYGVSKNRSRNQMDGAELEYDDADDGYDSDEYYH